MRSNMKTNQTGIVSVRATRNFSPISVNVEALDGNNVNLTESQILTQRKKSEENAAKNLQTPPLKCKKKS